MIIIQLAIILITAKIAGSISVKLGQPSVLGQLIAGILIGPAVFGFVEGNDFIDEMSTLGVIILMFIAGLETDIKEFKQNIKASTYVGFGGIILPLIAGYYSGVLLGLGFYESIFFGLVLTATSVSISVQSLREMGKLKTKEGMAILGAAVLDDIVVIVLLAVVMSFMGGDVSLSTVLLKKVVFFSIAILLMWKVIPWTIRLLSRMAVPQAPVGGALIICLLFAYFAEYNGVAEIIGAYFAGISIGTTDLGHKIIEKVEVVGYSLFVPIFFVSIGFSAQLNGVSEYLWLIIGLSIMAILSKMVGSGLGAKLAGYKWKSSLQVGAGMVSRGEVALILAALSIEHKIIESQMFIVLIIVVLVTTLVTPSLLKILYQDKKVIGEQQESSTVYSKV
ncbi:cation:proton antiporter [Schinkia azotoformans]|uniref:cation:proton antiporter n=1 Tax=Schinkia azotoformans TaxID=1454 RepID=UPI002DBF4720|nr:cation:proton antiporter [Schinkia azotoformans]MEC1695513.1 cation:proton antiporter [Schinkia azotoformans]MEC1727162.1 cation:proton antiporter [Schinkia azotoformans]MEC1781981.1 cation:proton antiporter [Schinkia azotoformans]MED4331178.1 cation:proton antiporter [Schinkia azotoformans]